MAELPFQDATFCWERGFVFAVRCTAQFWLVHADAICAAQPIRAVTLTTWPAWETAPVGNGYGRLTGRTRIESLGYIVGARDDSALIRKLLAAEWPRITFSLPEVGPSPLRGAYPVWQAM